MVASRTACLLILVLVSQVVADPPRRPITIGRGPPIGDPIENPDSWTFTEDRTEGYVESIGKDGITLYWPAGKMLRLRTEPISGEPLELKEIAVALVLGKKFLLDKELAKGGYLKTASGGWTYRITDVRVGDRVEIEYDRRDGIDICKKIRIDRRPNGLVPPAPGEKPDEFRKWHEEKNADQDWEVSRMPYPRKYWHNYRGPDGQFYAGPYPSESAHFVQSLTLAPPPRLVKGK